MADAKHDERAIVREQQRERFWQHLSCATIDSADFDPILREVALRMMMDQVPDEKICLYTRLSMMEIEAIRIESLDEAIRESECKSRAMLASLEHRPLG